MGHLPGSGPLHPRDTDPKLSSALQGPCLGPWEPPEGFRLWAARAPQASSAPWRHLQRRPPAPCDLWGSLVFLINFLLEYS